MDWQRASIIKTEQAADDIRSVLLRPEIWIPHRAGQHYDLRIPGTEISRKYSVVSSPNRIGELEFGIQLIEGGVISPKIWEMKIGDELEIQGPWGESFVWEPSMGGPIVLIGAGSGITPLLSIHDAYREKHKAGECYFLMSAKNEKKIMHFEKIRNSLITRFTERDGRIDRAFLRSSVSPRPETLCYVCGPDSFIDDIVDLLIELGFPEKGIKSERFI